MREKIGKITLDDTCYSGSDLYSDGPVEEELLEIAKSCHTPEEYNQVIAERKSWPVMYHFSHIRGNIVSWLPITKEDKVLEIGAGCGAITGALAKKAGSVTCVELSRQRSLVNAYRNEDCDNVTILLGAFEEVEKTLAEKYAHPNELKKKFGVTTQHYSFAVKAFVEMAKSFDTAKYDFAIRESKTREVIDDVASLRSEIGILYLSDFNRNVITKILRANDIEFHELMDCKSYVFLWKNHPLADRAEIHGEELSDYPFLSFEQGGNDSFYFSEELSSMNDYSQTVKVNDRATMVNLMVGLYGYTLCSGIVCEELNGGDYRVIPLSDDSPINGVMKVGYIVKKNQILSSVGKLYIEKIQEFLHAAQGGLSN